MAISRRNFLQAAGVTLVAVTGGGVYRTIDQGVFSVGQGPAYETWRNWSEPSITPEERIVRAGILASNPHNSQPWLFRIESNTITLYADHTRQIGTIDPFLREMHIGLGCAVENMMLAARAEGYRTTLNLMPNPAEEREVARIVLQAGSVQNSSLYEAIPNRHTDRAAYDTERPVSRDVLEAISALNDEEDVRLFWFHTETERTQFGEIVINATEALTSDEQQSIDGHDWWRHGWRDIQQKQDGLTLDAQGLDELFSAVAKIIPDISRAQADDIFLSTVRDTQVPTAAFFGMMAVPDGMSNEQRLKCGLIWQRIHLWGTTQGLVMQPLNQMCERADRERQLGIDPVYGNAMRALLNDDEWQGIMPFRAGYPTRTARLSPRRTLDKVLL